MRAKSGQYWLRPLQDWDSRLLSLGAYCSTLNLVWSIDGNTWNQFTPDQDRVSINVMMSDYSQYMTKGYWQELVQAQGASSNVRLSEITLLLAHQSLEDENLRQAAIEAVTALEILIGELFRESLSTTLFDKTSRFRDLGIAAMVPIVGAMKKLPAAEIENVLEVIEKRNKIVHNGWDPTVDPAFKKRLKGILKTIASQIPGPRILLPRANHGNRLESATGVSPS